MPPPRKLCGKRVLTKHNHYFNGLCKTQCDDSNFKHAFTLAEVLITLGIIGVVAALTLPALIAKHQRKTVAVKVKKAYTELYQAVRMSEAENGDMKDWNYRFSANNIENTKQFIDTYIAPYYTSLKLCSTGNGGGKNSCGAVVSGGGANYTTANGTGLSFVVSQDANNVPTIIDTNGAKGPNIIGTDYFYYGIKDSKVLPAGWYDGITREEILNNSTYSCKKTGVDENDKNIYTLRHGCTALLLIDGWEFKDDYPY